MAYHKYRNVPTIIDNTRFASQAEGRRYEQLKLLVKAEMITDLEPQPKYELQAKYTNGAGCKIRALSYVADFRYTDIESGDIVIEDVKREQTSTVQYKIKKKLFEKIYYPLTISEVDA